MSSSGAAVAVRGLSKAYQISHGHHQPSTLAEAVLGRLRRPFQRVPKETFWALKDVSFDVQAGEVVGIIGRNGAGKSTLLKVLSRITEPTAGEVDLYGRVSSLLEVGTGFHPELTGRENIFLNGAILGMSKAEIRREFAAIVDFAGVSQFLDTPVKRYSSGMYVRLAFAVAAHLQSEVLVIDEVLAVGDADFQKKSLGRMRDAAKGGRTVLFVSHNMSAVRSLCTRVVHLAAGQVKSISNAVDGVASYLREATTRQHDSYEGRDGLRLLRPRFYQRDGTEAGTTLEFGRGYQLKMTVQSPQPLRAALVISVYDEEGLKVSSINSVEEGCDYWDLSQVRDVICDLPDLQLMPGNYQMTIDLCDQVDLFLRAEGALCFSVEPRCIDGAAWAYNKSHGVYRMAEAVHVR